MLPVDETTLKAVAQTYRGARAATQAATLAAIGPILADTLARAAIDSPLRIAHFLAQMCLECADFTALEEEGSRAYFDRYNGRMGNLPPDDGWLFRGRGLIQLTGRQNYAAFGPLVSRDLLGAPDSAAEPVVALDVACAFWTRHDLNAAADADDIVLVTKRINGGCNGLDRRRAYLAKAKAVLARMAAGALATDGDPASPVLHLGQDVPAVVDLQRLLAGAGYAVAVDGLFGAGTELAVTLFQRARALAPDGIVGPSTWAALRSPPPAAR